MIAGWPQLEHRLLFVTVAVLVAFGTKQIIVDYLFAAVERVIFYGMFSFQVSEIVFKVKAIVFALSEIVLVPLLLRRLFLVMKRRPDVSLPSPLSA